MKFTIRRSNLSLAVVMALTASTVYAAVPATSAFNTDPVEKHVADHALEVFGSAEQILCDVAQLKTESFINKGAYVALMDQNIPSAIENSVLIF